MCISPTDGSDTEYNLYKKFELMLTRRGKAYSSSCSVVQLKIEGVHTKLIYKYQILYLDRITTVQWRHLVMQPEVDKKFIKPPILAFKVIDLSGNRKPVHDLDFLLVINSNLGPISHHYWDTATYWLKIANFAHPPLI